MSFCEIFSSSYKPHSCWFDLNWFLFVCLNCSRNSDIGECLAGKVQMSLGILTDDGFFVMTSNIVPFDSISVKVVQNSHASFFLSSLLSCFTVVGLTTGWVESSGEGPVLESSSICGIEPSLISRPEPSIDWLGEEIGAVTAVKVTQASRGPDIFDVSNSLLEPLIFILSFDADQIHATFAAIIPSVEPIPVGRAYWGVVGLPWEKVVAASVLFNTTVV